MTTELMEEERPVVVPAEGPAPPVEDPSAEAAKPAEAAEAAQPAEPARPRWSKLRALRTFVVVVALLAGATYGGVTIVHQRLAAATMVDLGTAVLVADPVPVGSADAGVVNEIKVSEQSQVKAGQELAVLTLTANGTSTVAPTQVLRAPEAGIVSAVNVSVGSVARAGEPVITLYDPAKLEFTAQVPVKDLRNLRVGMAAYITGAGLAQPVAAKLDHVVPKVGSDPVNNTDRLTVVLVPKAEDVARVSRLVPGLQFTATVDTKTAVGATPAVNSAG
jgi:multidrug efflux pump subunit AcrA (membrane-fusion protein)